MPRISLQVKIVNLPQLTAYLTVTIKNKDQMMRERTPIKFALVGGSENVEE